MKKRNAMICMLAAGLLAACQSPTKSEKSDVNAETSEQTAVASTLTAIPFTVAERYFLKNNAQPLESPTITTEEAFQALFGAAAVIGENGKPTPIDFATQYVIAVAKPETNIATSLQPVSLKRDKEGDIVFTYQVKKGEKQSFTVVPCLLIIVDKSETGHVVLKEID